MSQKKLLKIFIASGGTGGHLLSAQKLGAKLEKNAKITFIGKGLKKNPFFKKNAFDFFSICSAPIYKNLRFFSSFVLILVGCFQSLFFLALKRPQIVVGFGSYHTFPILFVAKLLGKKILLFEANCVVGQVNRIIASEKIPLACQFPLAKTPKGKKIIPVTPYPFTESEKPVKKTEKKQTILLFGGSQGAEFINTTFIEMVKTHPFPYRIFHITGSVDRKNFFEKEYKKLSLDAKVFSYVEDMRALFLAADLVICRGGALTIAELLHYQKPAIIIPYPRAKDDHQKVNGQFFKRMGSGELFNQKDLSPEKLQKGIIKLLGDKNLLKNLCDYKRKKSIDLDKLVLKICRKKTTIS